MTAVTPLPPATEARLLALAAIECDGDDGDAFAWAEADRPHSAARGARTRQRPRGPRGAPKPSSKNPSSDLRP